MRLIVRAVKKNPKISAPKLSTMLSADHRKTVYPRTENRAIQRSGLKSQVARKNPPNISKINCKKSLAFATKWLDAPETWWNSEIFSDESKYNIFGSDGYQRVWRSPNTEFKENTIATLKRGGGNIMIWGCMSTAGVGKLAFINGIMTKESNIELLWENLPGSTEKFGLQN